MHLYLALARHTHSARNASCFQQKVATEAAVQVLAVVERQKEAFAVTITMPASHKSNSIQW